MCVISQFVLQLDPKHVKLFGHIHRQIEEICTSMKPGCIKYDSLCSNVATTPHLPEMCLSIACAELLFTHEFNQSFIDTGKKII
jgi:hypothetical protein